jgi:hypothetical protein
MGVTTEELSKMTTDELSESLQKIQAKQETVDTSKITDVTNVSKIQDSVTDALEKNLPKNDAGSTTNTNKSPAKD